MRPGEHRIDLRDAGGRIVTGRTSVGTEAPVVFERALDEPPPQPSPPPVEDVTPKPAPVVPKPPAPLPEPDVVAPLPSPSTSSPLRWWILGGSSAGLGVAAIVTGGVLTALAQSDLDELRELSASPSSEETLRRDAEVRTRFARREGAGIALFVSGAVLTGVGVTTIIFAATSSTSDERQAELFVMPGGLGVRGRF